MVFADAGARVRGTREQARGREGGRAPWLLAFRGRVGFSAHSEPGLTRSDGSSFSPVKLRGPVQRRAPPSLAAEPALTDGARPGTDPRTGPRGLGLPGDRSSAGSRPRPRSPRTVGPRRPA